MAAQDGKSQHEQESFTTKASASEGPISAEADSAEQKARGPPQPARTLPADFLLGRSKNNEELFRVACSGAQRLAGEIAEAEQRALRMAREVIDEMRSPFLKARPEPAATDKPPSTTWEDVALPGRTSASAAVEADPLESDAVPKPSEAAEAAEQPEINPAGDLQDDPVPRKDEETAAECIRLQSILDRMKQLMREERAVWNEERAQLLEELSATRRALSASEAAREAAELALAQSSVMRASSLPSAASAPSASLQPSFQPPSRHDFGSLGNLGSLRSGPESAEIAVLKDGVRKALDAMSLERPSGPSVQEFRAYGRQMRPAGQWTRMQLEGDRKSVV